MTRSPKKGCNQGLNRQPWNVGRRIAVASIAFLGLGFLVFATAGANVEGRVAGAGSTLVNPTLQRVSTSYRGYLAADRLDGVEHTGSSEDWSAGDTALDYDPVGSIGRLVRPMGVTPNPAQFWVKINILPDSASVVVAGEVAHFATPMARAHATVVLLKVTAGPREPSGSQQ